MVGGVNVAAIDEFKWSKILASRKFAASTSFHRLNGHELTKEWVERSGMKRPVIIENPEGLGMQMPPSSLTVRLNSISINQSMDHLKLYNNY